MSIEIKALSPEMAQTYVNFMDSKHFDHSPHWASCYCRYYHLDCSAEVWQARTASTNREEAIEEIQAGRMKGYLAFDQGVCIGWLNANSIHAYPLVKADIKDLVSTEGLALAICYVIAAEYRNQGISKTLLKFAINDLKATGYTKLLVLPIDKPNRPESMYRGIRRSYEALGFKTIQEEGPLTILTLDL